MYNNSLDEKRLKYENGAGAEKCRSLYIHIIPKRNMTFCLNKSHDDQSTW